MLVYAISRFLEAVLDRIEIEFAARRNERQRALAPRVTGAIVKTDNPIDRVERKRTAEAQAR